MNIDEKYMSIALKEAMTAEQEDEVPIGCVIVSNGKVIAQTHNQKKQKTNALYHAEILALQEAMKKKESPYLEDCDMYVTLEPCLMCAGAIVQSRIKRVVFATREPKGGSIVSSIVLREVPRINHYPEYQEGVLQEESSAILKRFFQQKRQNKK